MTWALTGVPPDSLDRVWPIAEELLRPAVARSGGRATCTTIEAGIREQRYQLWVAHQEDVLIRAAFVTRVAEYPARRMLVVDFAAGSAMGEWVDLVQRAFREYALAAGLSGVELHGRVGWARVLERLGWRQEFVVLSVGVPGEEV